MKQDHGNVRLLGHPNGHRHALGALPFAAIGLFIGAYTSANVPPAITNVVFLPMRPGPAAFPRR